MKSIFNSSKVTAKIRAENQMSFKVTDLDTMLSTKGLIIVIYIPNMNSNFNNSKLMA